MPDAVIFAIGALAGAAIVLAVLGVRRLAHGARDLGSDAERAAYRTLHLAARAARDLRGGASADRHRAARHMRTMLGAQALALVGTDGSVAMEPSHPELEAAARSIAATVGDARTRQVFPKQEASPHGWEAVGAPIIVDTDVWGVVIAFASPLRAPLVRATGEVAQWASSQLQLGELDASRTALAEAELRALRAQISPHFIYNALTAIASFTTTDPARARKLVLTFADFTRYSFRRHGEFTTLAEELQAIHSYLEIERARFGDRLGVRLRISPETLTTVIPYLSLQPLVENAVKHGLEPGIDGGLVTIASVDDGTHTEITVEDNGVGMAPDRAQALLEASATSDHVGLRNVDRRLRQLYGDEAGLVIETNEGAGTMVRVRVPKSQPDHEAP